jgi:serine protease Do
LIVDSSRPGSPAESAGFKSGDVIAKVGKVTVLDAADFERGLLGHAAGDEVLVLVKRDGKSETVSIKLAAVANEALASGSGNVIVHPESDPLSQRIWEVIGIRVSKIQRASAKLVNTTSQYEGGLEVLAIRPASPAAQGGMRQHDVVVGLDKWQTIKMEDVSWILDHRVADAPPPLRFHVVRSNAIFFGDMTLDGHAH